MNVARMTPIPADANHQGTGVASAALSGETMSDHGFGLFASNMREGFR